MKKYTKGFTLIELLVVIAIIGILASVVLVSLNSARKKGNDTRIIADVQQVRTQLETDYTNGNYLSDLVTNSATATVGGATAGSNASTTINTLFLDAANNGGQLRVVSNAGATAYAVFGQLASDPTKTFCVASNGSTNQATTATAFASITTGYITCN